MDRPSDEDLLRRLADGDVTALGQVYDRYAGIVNGLALRILRDRGDAEDVVQEVFVQIWREAARFDRERGNPGAWICMLARSRALDRLRRKQARPEHAVAGLEPAVSVPEPAVTSAVRTALGRLPPEQRTLLELAYYEGLTQVEIASRLRTPLGTIKTRMRTALGRLRRSLSP
jgi:RNA polymerase sigma-70 factor, ECF subfamily